MSYYDHFAYPDPGESAPFGVAVSAFEALGEVAVSFEDLDAQFAAAISFLLRRGDQVGQIVAAELPFKGKVNLFGALARSEIADPADLTRLDSLVSACFDAEQHRNTVLHSKWRRNVDDSGSVVRQKYTARHKHGLRQQSQTLTPIQIQALGLHCQYLAYSLDEFMYGSFGTEYGAP